MDQTCYPGRLATQWSACWRGNPFNKRAGHGSILWGSMGLVYLPTWMVDFYGFHVGKYTSPMDPQGYFETLNSQPFLWTVDSLEPRSVGRNGPFAASGFSTWKKCNSHARSLNIVHIHTIYERDIKNISVNLDYFPQFGFKIPKSLKPAPRCIGLKQTQLTNYLVQGIVQVYGRMPNKCEEYGYANMHAVYVNQIYIYVC